MGGYVSLPVFYFNDLIVDRYACRLSPEKRFYYERFTALLQVICAIKVDNFGKKSFLPQRLSVVRHDDSAISVFVLLSASSVFSRFTIAERKATTDVCPKYANLWR